LYYNNNNNGNSTNTIDGSKY